MKIPEEASLDRVRLHVDALKALMLDVTDQDGRSQFNGMDPWQQALESKLGQLRRDTRSIATDVNVLQSDLGAMRKSVARLASKGFILVALIWALVVAATVSVFSADLRSAAVHGLAQITLSRSTDNASL